MWPIDQSKHESSQIWATSCPTWPKKAARIGRSWARVGRDGASGPVVSEFGAGFGRSRATRWSIHRTLGRRLPIMCQFGPNLAGSPTWSGFANFGPTLGSLSTCRTSCGQCVRNFWSVLELAGITGVRAPVLLSCKFWKKQKRYHGVAGLVPF